MKKTNHKLLIALKFFIRSGKRDTISLSCHCERRLRSNPVFQGLRLPRRTAPRNDLYLQSGKRDSNPRLRPWQGRTLPLSYSRKLLIDNDISVFQYFCFYRLCQLCAMFNIFGN